MASLEVDVNDRDAYLDLRVSDLDGLVLPLSGMNLNVAVD